MTYDNEAIVRHTYHTAEGNVMDVQGFIDLFASTPARRATAVSS